MGREHRQLAGLIARALRAWQNVGSLELRYAWGGSNIDRPLRLFLIGRALGQRAESARAWADQMLRNVAGLFPAGYDFGPIQGHLPVDVQAWVEIERAEEVRSPGQFVPRDIASYYYLLHPLGGSGAGWPSLPRALAANDRPGFLSITLFPTTMTDSERAAIDHISSIARYLSEPQSGYDFFGHQTNTPADAAARDLHRAWQTFSGRDGLLARIGVSAPRDHVNGIASTVGSILVDDADRTAEQLPGKFKVITDLTEYEAFETATTGVVLPRSRHPVWSLPDTEAPLSVGRMVNFFSEEEAGGLLLLPVPDGQGVPGMRGSRAATQRRAGFDATNSGPGVRLGVTLNQGAAGGPLLLPLTAINRHSLVVGAPGSGKTTTVLTMLTELWREHRVPFLVIEPTKTEYRSLLETPGLDDVRVICLGRDDIAPMRLNPLAPPPGVRREVHVNSLMAALKLALPLWPPLPQLLEEALDRTYELAGWELDTTADSGAVPPTLRSLAGSFDSIFEQQGYTGEANNLGVAVGVRLRSLLRGSRGLLLDTVESVDFDELLRRPVVVELDEIADNDDKLVLSAFLLDRIRAAARARGSSGGQLRHVTVVEEAHRLLGRDHARSSDPSSGNSLRADAVRAFCDAIAELRASGEGFVLSSQSPSALADVAVANTSVRIMHLMESAADRKVILDDLDASPLDRSTAARLLVGEALVRWTGGERPELIAVQPSHGVDSGRGVPNGRVAERMSVHNASVRSLLPFRLCTREICIRGCQTQVRSAGQMLAIELAPDVRQQWGEARSRSASAPNSAIEPAMNVIAAKTGGDAQLTYCTAAHLADANQAFDVPGRDLRREVTHAARQAASHPGP